VRERKVALPGEGHSSEKVPASNGARACKLA
jgi:hypothetical protein